MTKKKRSERRLILLSKRRVPSDEGVARLVAAMVLHQLEQQRQEAAGRNEESSA